MGEKDRAGAMFTLDELAQTIDARAGASAEASYTRSLLGQGRSPLRPQIRRRSD